MDVAYFDNAASTRVDPRVLEVMRPYFCESYANTSALHAMAFEGKAAVEEARAQVAALFGAADPSEVVFTSGATEANNTILNCFSGRILYSAIEHPSVRIPCGDRDNAVCLPVNGSGTLELATLTKALESPCDLVSVMLVNNEIGSIQDIDTIGQIAHDAGAKLHSDVTQAVGKVDLHLRERPIDYATISAHKFHGPNGVGAMWIRDGARFRPLLVGGSHESKRRAGTMNTACIVGMGKAAQIAVEGGEQEQEKLRAFRDRILREVTESIDDVKVNGQKDGAPHILSLSFRGVEGESIIVNLDSKGICCTAGSACSSGSGSNSPVLEAIGLDEEWLRGTVRISTSRFTTDDDIDRLVAALQESVGMLRQLAGFSR